MVKRELAKDRIDSRAELVSKWHNYINVGRRERLADSHRLRPIESRRPRRRGVANRCTPWLFALIRRVIARMSGSAACQVQAARAVMFGDRADGHDEDQALPGVGQKTVTTVHERI